MFTFGLAFAELWGYPTALAALVGVVTSVVCGAIADCTKRFKELLRVCWVCCTATIIFTRFWLRNKWTGPIDSVVFLVACAGLGGFSIPQFPIGVEMGVETTFPIYEATSSGLLVLSGQLWMFVMYYVFETTKKLKIIYEFDDTKLAGNWQLNLDIWCFLGVVAMVLSFIVNPT
ncbi:hypothetical protein COOONC_24341 [Cooperia oncophora]